MTAIDAGEEAIARFRVRLNELHRQVHRPTYAKVKEYAAKGGDVLATSTISNLLRGPGTPRPDTVRKFVFACKRFAERNAPEVPSTAFDLTSWLDEVDALRGDDSVRPYRTAGVAAGQRGGSVQSAGVSLASGDGVPRRRAVAPVRWP